MLISLPIVFFAIGFVGGMVGGLRLLFWSMDRLDRKSANKITATSTEDKN